MISLILAIVLVFLTLLVEFRSFAHPIAIVTGAVLALGGVLLGLFITKTTLNVVSLMGMIMIVGIVAKNGILDRKSTRLNSSHANISYAVFCLHKQSKRCHLPDLQHAQEHHL